MTSILVAQNKTRILLKLIDYSITDIAHEKHNLFPSPLRRHSQMKLTTFIVKSGFPFALLAIKRKKKSPPFGCFSFDLSILSLFEKEVKINYHLNPDIR